VPALSVVQLYVPALSQPVTLSMAVPSSRSEQSRVSPLGVAVMLQLID